MTGYSEPVVTTDCRSALRRKYEQIARLRRHATERTQPADQARRAMRALAAQFPGALRELDELPMEAIESRLLALDPSHDAEAPLPWMEAQLAFHALVRGVLLVKRWLRNHPGESLDHFTKWTTNADALAWSDHLERVAKPPSGRLLELVYPLLAQRFSITPDEARVLVFGDSLRRRREAMRSSRS